MSDCSICCEAFNASTRLPIKCPHCQEDICRLCTKKYLLSIADAPHCMMCRYVWSFTFLYEALPKSFIMEDLKRHRQDVLLQIQKAYLPQIQPLAEEERERRVHYELMQKQRSERHQYNTELSQNRLKYARNREKMEGLSHKDPRYLKLKERNRLLKEKDKEIRAKRSNLEGPRVRPIRREKEEKTYTIARKCPGDGCRGFLDEKWLCPLCQKKTCLHCYIQVEDRCEQLGCEKQEEDNLQKHVCQKDDVETTKLLKKETKPCPQCGASISKIDGCNQMFCTLCHQVFDWVSGKKSSARAHNPHYFEWRRRGGQNERDPDDLPCGGLPDYIRDPVLNLLDREDRRKIERFDEPFGDQLKKLDIDEVTKEDLEKYRRTNNILRLTHHINDIVTHLNHNGYQDLGIKYLLGEIDEDRWKKLLSDRERDQERKRAYIQIIQMYILAATDIFQKIASINGYKHDEFNRYYQELDALIEYYNNEVVKVGNILKNKYQSYLITEDRIENRARILMGRYL